MPRLVAIALATAVVLAGCGGSSSSGSSAIAFCTKIRQLNKNPNSIFNGLGALPSVSASTPSAKALPAFQRIESIFEQLSADAPSSLKPDVASVLPVLRFYVDALEHTKTIAQFGVYATAHPPNVDITKTAAAEKRVTTYVKNTCHVAVKSS